MISREDGNASIEFVWLALILLVPIVYIVLAVFEVQRAAFATSAASRAAARAFVLAPDTGSARREAEGAALLALADHGVDGATVRIDCRPRCHVPGSVVRVEVGAVVALPFLPEVLGGPLAGVPVEASHREPYGSYREGR